MKRLLLAVILVAAWSMAGYSQTALSTLASSMAPGTWAQLTGITDQNTVLGVGGVSSTTIHFSNTMPWNPISRVVEIIGADHSYPQLRYMQYDDATNAFVLVADDAGVGSGHGYDHSTLNPSTGDIYYREYSGFTGMISTEMKPYGSLMWTALPTVVGSEQVAIGTCWWSGPFIGAGSQGTFMVFNSGNTNTGTPGGSSTDGQIVGYNPLTNTWFYNEVSRSPFFNVVGMGTGTYHSIMEYSPQKNVAVYGGGNDAPSNLWKMDALGIVTAMPDVPAGKYVGIQRGNLVNDPSTGNFLLLSAGELWELNPDDAGTWTQKTSPPMAVGDPYGGGTSPVAVISSSISDYGVVMYITQPSSTGGNVYLYKPDSSSADFTSRCTATGVVRCFNFDTDADFDHGAGGTQGAYQYNFGIVPIYSTSDYSKSGRDTTQKADGSSSLKFTIPSLSGSDSSGSWFTNFSTDLATQFGAGETFYVQWRQRFSPEFLTNAFSPGAGWKQAIIGTGDTSAPVYFSSCTDLEITTQNTLLRGFPQLYNSCSGSSSHGPYSPFEEAYGMSDFKLENARPDPFCLYSQVHTMPVTAFPPDGNCFAYAANEWMTFQIEVTIGPRGSAGVSGASPNDEFVNSHINMWAAREGQPSELIFNWGPYNLTAGAAVDDQQFGKIWLLPYHTSKDDSISYPEAYTWYDDLIVSTNRIADPTISASTSGDSSRIRMHH